ncbi:hypothetical protein V2K57_11755 [Pseudomonas alliivorans]|nr:hypothetical protein [Pseudomonas alliivorans]MEE4701415.1 hypothetical protein [Pseudomonas alliivorans]MEE4737051.1 hypothetical protein [Pseudomonas alliivorans]
MNAATKVLPLTERPAKPCTPAEQRWIENHAEYLMRGADVTFKRRMHGEKGVTQKRFHHALDELLMERLSRTGASNWSLGMVMHGVLIGDVSMARDGLVEALGLPDCKRAVIEIAESLLRPLAADGLIAQLEDEQ